MAYTRRSDLTLPGVLCGFAWQLRTVYEKREMEARQQNLTVSQVSTYGVEQRRDMDSNLDS